MCEVPERSKRIDGGRGLGRPTPDTKVTSLPCVDPSPSRRRVSGVPERGRRGPVLVVPCFYRGRVGFGRPVARQVPGGRGSVESLGGVVGLPFFARPPGLQFTAPDPVYRSVEAQSPTLW